MKVRPYQGVMPQLGKNVYIDDTALVIGKVTIGDDSSVWPFAVVRGDVNVITIGEKTNIQDHCTLHVTHAGPYNPQGAALTLGNYVTVGHQCVLHACTIQDYCLIGIGSRILDDVIVEPYVVLGAGSLVPPGKRLESGFLYLGSPVKKVRALTQQELSFFEYSALKYVELQRDGYTAARE